MTFSAGTPTFQDLFVSAADGDEEEEEMTTQLLQPLRI